MEFGNYRNRSCYLLTITVFDLRCVSDFSQIGECLLFTSRIRLFKMAEGVILGFDPLFTVDVVRDFMLSNGGKVSNHTLVTHFKSFLNDSQRKNANRQMFKQYVNTLAVVKLDVSGEKLLVLKKKFRDSGSFRGEPAAAKYIPSDQDRMQAKRAKTEDAQTVEETDVHCQLPSDIEDLNDDKENLGKSSSLNSSAVSMHDKIDEELETSTDEPTMEHDTNNTGSDTPDDLGQSSDSADIEHTDVTQVDSSASTEISAMENVDNGLCILMLYHFTVRRYGLSHRNSVCPSITLVDCVHLVRPTIMISSEDATFEFFQ